MLFSYTLLFAMLTTFVAAAPASSNNQGQRPDRGQKLNRPNPNGVQKSYRQPNRQQPNRQVFYPQGFYREQTPVPDLPAPTKLLDAAKYLNYLSRPLFEVGWTRLPSASESANTFGIVFGTNDEHGFFVHFCRISPIDGRTEYNYLQTVTVSQLNFETLPAREIVGSWYQRQTKRQMKITYNKEEKQFYISPFTADSVEKEMTFKKPTGLVPLVLPNCFKTAAGYLAALGGEWSWVDDPKSSSQPGVRFIFFEVQRTNGEDVLHVKREKRESDGGISPVTDDPSKHGFLVGVWKRELSSEVVDKIEITYGNNKLVMLVLQHNHSLTLMPKHM